ncbi:MAG: SRPBCC family protein [Bryobacterales bacterium]|nr:SRPBCC family protein [Bryobacterales bacterium]MBV9399072.1 SRPBCC family protein [Bryobacterales bacterium]
MNAVKIAISGFAAGAAYMYFSDPDRGKRRRALVRDQSIRISNRFTSLLDKARRDAANRVQGTACAVRSLFRDRTTLDDIVVQRVRSKLGRLVSHPHAVEVASAGGNVTLSGLVLRNEETHLVRCVRAVPGVRSVDNKLEAHDSAEHVSSLQGGQRRESRSELMQQNWTPALRVTAGALGGVLLSYGARKSGPGAIAGRLAGAALVSRAISNRQFCELTGVGNHARGVDVSKTIHIQAPAEEIFKYWSQYDKLPLFMSHLKEVRDLGNGKSHWVAEGPGGIPVSWDAEIIQAMPNKLLAWHSVPGSTVETEGVVRFDPNSHGGTRVTIRMRYKPPAGVLGHYITSLFRANPKSEIKEDMVRLKSLLEIGKTRAHGVRVDKQSLNLGLGKA